MTETRQPFGNSRDAALALLADAVQRGEVLDRRVASFLGTCAGCGDLTPRMQWWLRKLLAEAALPSVEA